MNRRVMQVLITTSLLLFSSLAGCLDSEKDSSSDSEYTVIASTYHVGQIASAIGGSDVNVQILSPSNVPVHDYEPSANDILTLASADLFLYHGLGLEPWVDATLSAMGDDEPRNMFTHAMPDGQQAFDYESLLIMDLCEHLTEGPYEASTLVDHAKHAEDVELHAEHVAHTLSLPEDDHDDDHDEHNDTHDDHGDDHDDHGDEDGHEGHGHADPMETITSLTDCPANSMVYLFELGEGEYVLEFETEEDVHEFNMVVLKMGGGHAHHDHGDDHDDHGDDHDEEMTPEQALAQFDTNNDGQLSWEEFWDSMNVDAHDNHDDHGDENNVAVLYPDNTSALFDNHQHDMDSGWNLTMDAMQENNITLDYSVDPNYGTMLSGINGVIAPADYSWWWSLYLWNETSEAWQVSPVGIDSIVIGEDSEHIAWAASNADLTLIPVPEDHDDDHAGEDGHDDHGNDGNDTEDMYMEIFNTTDMNNDQMLNLSELGEFIEMLEDDEHEGAYATLHIEEEGVYGFALPMSINFHILKGEGGHDDHDDHAGEDDHDDHSDEEGDDHSDHADEEIAFDPHSWLDPLAFKAQVNRVLEEMKIAFPDLADNFQSNADAYMASLDALHLKYEDTFGANGTCEKDTVVSNHNAYSYMSQRYGMEFVTVHGLDPEGEPSAADILEVVEQITEDGITIFYVEEYTDLSAVASIVEQTKSSTMPDGVEIQILYTMELQPKESGEDYLSLMEKNLDALKSGLSC
mgnify:CR=1 FL=1